MTSIQRIDPPDISKTINKKGAMEQTPFSLSVWTIIERMHEFIVSKIKDRELGVFHIPACYKKSCKTGTCVFLYDLKNNFTKDLDKTAHKMVILLYERLEELMEAYDFYNALSFDIQVNPTIILDGHSRPTNAFRFYIKVEGMPYYPYLSVKGDRA